MQDARRYGLAEAFVAGALAMATFHQPMAGVLHALDSFPVSPFDLTPKPSGLPAMVQGMLWSGGWGVLFVLLLRLRPGLPLAPAAIAYCATVPIGFLFLVMATAQGAPPAFGMPVQMALSVVLAHAAWGFGIALWLAGMRGLRGAPAAGRDQARA